MFSLNDLPVPLEEYFSYRPPTTEARKKLHDSINELALNLAKSVRDGSQSQFKYYRVEFLSLPIKDEMTKNWAVQEMERASNLFLNPNEEKENFELIKLKSIKSIQLARMFANQAATIDELTAKKGEMLEKIKIKAEYLGLCDIDSCYSYLTDTNEEWMLFSIGIPPDYYTPDGFTSAAKKKIAQHINSNNKKKVVTEENIELNLVGFDSAEPSRLKMNLGPSFFHYFGCYFEEWNKLIPVLF